MNKKPDWYSDIPMLRLNAPTCAYSGVPTGGNVIQRAKPKGMEISPRTNKNHMQIL